MYVKGSMKSRQTIYVNMWEISAEREREIMKRNQITTLSLEITKSKRIN